MTLITVFVRVALHPCDFGVCVLVIVGLALHCCCARKNRFIKPALYVIAVCVPECVCACVQLPVEDHSVVTNTSKVAQRKNPNNRGRIVGGTMPHPSARFESTGDEDGSACCCDGTKLCVVYILS